MYAYLRLTDFYRLPHNAWYIPILLLILFMHVRLPIFSFIFFIVYILRYPFQLKIFSVALWLISNIPIPNTISLVIVIFYNWWMRVKDTYVFWILLPHVINIKMWSAFLWLYLCWKDTCTAKIFSDLFENYDLFSLTICTNLFCLFDI